MESSRNVRWKLRSSVKRCTNYCESSSSDDTDSELSEQEDNQSSKLSKHQVSKFKKARRSINDLSPPTKTRKTKDRRDKPEKRTERSIASYFGGGKSAPQKEHKLNLETRAFLASGVPEVVVRAQKVIHKRKEQEEILDPLALFPKITLVGNDPNLQLQSHPPSAPSPFPTLKLIKNNASDASTKPLVSCTFASFISGSGNTPESPSPLCCTWLETEVGWKMKAPLVPSPWIHTYKVKEVKNLMGNKASLNNLTRWLKQWKSDIKDDGGTGRKLVEKKKKRRDSDSDFITSEEEEEEFKNKSLLLSGPTGCGKTTAVYVIAKHLGFHVVEVNFSTRRSGKDVLQRVEEAVLSHRLASSQNCLLLFKDIELLDAEEDEGFHGAVAQLITTAVRPIVMTTGRGIDDALDPKIEKKDPLRISFQYPKSWEIVEKVLLPIVKQEEVEEIESHPIHTRPLTSLLSSITRHARCDVRQVINQAQFIFSSLERIKVKSVHENWLEWNEDGLNLDFVCSNGDRDSETPSPLSKRVDELEKTVEALSFLSDLDWMEGRTEEVEHENVRAGTRELQRFYFCPNYLAVLSKNFGCDKRGLEVMRRLTYQNDQDKDQDERIWKGRNEIGDYSDVVGDGSWDSASYIRTIVKQNVMDSVGRRTKRNGRMTRYFNRLDHGLVDKICQTFGFHHDLEIAKSITFNNSS